MIECEKLAKRDRETFITYNEEESTAICFTSSKRLIRTLDGLCEKCKDIRCTRATEYGKTYRLPKVWVSVLSGCGAAGKCRK